MIMPFFGRMSPAQITSAIAERAIQKRKAEVDYEKGIPVVAYQELGNIFYKLSVSTRWRLADETFDELSKQGLNTIIAFFLACDEEYAGRAVIWENIPKYIIWRCFKKAYVLADEPAHVIKMMCETGKVNKDDFDRITEERISEKYGSKLARELRGVKQTREARIMKAATKIATLVEVMTNKYRLGNEFDIILGQVRESCKEFEEEFAGFKKLANPNGKEFKLLEELSNLRAQVRWSSYARPVICTVLGHCLDTGILLYFQTLENNPGNHGKATKMFFVGAFHDIPERYTGDIPSPVKDLIKGYREASEIIENEMLETHVYSVLDDYTAGKLKEIMIAGEGAKQDKPYVKGADYLSAMTECERAIIGGTRDFNYFRAMKDTMRMIQEGKIRVSNNARKFAKQMLSRARRYRRSFIYY